MIYLFCAAASPLLVETQLSAVRALSTAKSPQQLMIQDLTSCLALDLTLLHHLLTEKTDPVVFDTDMCLHKENIQRHEGYV